MTATAVLAVLWTQTLAATGSASPEPAEVVDTPPPQLVTPGTIGFLVTFGVAVALVFLVRDMNRRVRRIRVRAERADAQLRAADAGAAGRPVAPGPADRPPTDDDGSAAAHGGPEWRPPGEPRGPGGEPRDGAPDPPR